MEKKKVLILGADGQIARHVIRFLQDNENVSLTLFLRNAGELKGIRNPDIKIMVGDVLKKSQLQEAVKGQDVVYANLAGEVDKMAKEIITSMEANDVKRLIFVTTLGILDEVPGKFGQWNNSMIGAYMGPYRKAADAIEASGLEYTIVRPAWLTDYDEVEYELTQKGKAFKGTEVSRKSVAAFIADIIMHPQQQVNVNVGINKPNTDGDKPAFY